MDRLQFHGPYRDTEQISCYAGLLGNRILDPIDVSICYSGHDRETEVRPRCLDLIVSPG